MRLIFVLALLFLVFLKSYSQNLQGEWKGTFTAYLPSTTIVNQYYKNEITIEIIQNTDSTYSIFSYAGDPYVRGHHTDYKCEIEYIMVSDNTIILEEAKVVSPEGVNKCLKKMNLKIVTRKKSISLEGSWQTNSGDCNNEGKIQVSKKL
jgi:hypothetical protein